MKKGRNVRAFFFPVLTAAFCLFCAGRARGAAGITGGHLQEMPGAVRRASKARKNTIPILPSGFEKNLGQAPRGVGFLSRRPGCAILFDPKGTSILVAANAKAKGQKGKNAPGMRKDIKTETERVLRMDFEAEERGVALAGAGRLPGKVNYLEGRDQAKWITGVPSYARLYYRGLYPGISAVFTAVPSETISETKSLRVDFIVQPGADPGRIRLRFKGSKLSIDKAGSLIVRAGGLKALLLKKPCIYQEVAGGGRVPVNGGFVLTGEDSAAFRIARYDKKRALVIDPDLLFSTFLGGSAADQGQGIAADTNGNVYVTGFTSSPNFPLVGPAKLFTGSTDAFVTKISLSPSPHIVYSTVIGGNDVTQANAIAVDSSGEAFITGYTSSPDFPAVSPLQAFLQGSRNIFVTELSADGSKLLYSTFFGGGADDEGRGIALDTSKNIYVTGFATSTNFPLLNSTRAAPALSDAFAVKILAGGSKLGYSVLLGGQGSDTGAGIAVNSAGDAYVTGSTSSTDFPVVNPRQAFLRGSQNAFLTELDPTGKILFSTFHGGGASDGAAAIALDSQGNAYIAGSATSPDFPLLDPIQTYRGGKDIFLSKFSPGGTLIYSTFLGGSADDSGTGVAVDTSGEVFITGQTISTDFPLLDQVQGITGGVNAFVEEINAAGSALVYSTILGGSSTDFGTAIALDSAGDAFITGSTDSPDFLTKNAVLGYAGSTDAFVSEISNPNQPPSAPSLISPTNGQTGLGSTVTFSWSKSTDPDGDPITYQFFLCTNQSFQNCPPEQLAAAKSVLPREGPPLSMLLFTAFIFGTRRWRKMVLLLIAIALAAGMALASCGGGGTSSPPNTVQKTVSGLLGGTTYFWKVAALDGRGASAESGTNSFTTR